MRKYREKHFKIPKKTRTSSTFRLIFTLRHFFFFEREFSRIRVNLKKSNLKGLFLHLNLFSLTIKQSLKNFSENPIPTKKKFGFSSCPFTDKMKKEHQTKIKNIYANLRKKYAVGTSKLDFEEDLMEQLKDLIKKMQNEMKNKIELYEDDDSSYIEKLVPVDGVSSDESTEEENGDFIADSSDENEKVESESEEDELEFQNIDLTDAAAVLAALDKPVSGNLELDDEVESGYLENLQDSD